MCLLCLNSKESPNLKELFDYQSKNIFNGIKTYFKKGLLCLPCV